jgi:hypothetical protein
MYKILSTRLLSPHTLRSYASVCNRGKSRRSSYDQHNQIHVLPEFPELAREREDDLFAG